MKDGVIHLISDATGETLFTLTRACLAQFDKSEFTEYRWPLVRSDEDLDKVIAAIATEPGIVFYTIVAPNLGERLREECRTMKVPCVPILDPLINTIANYVGTPAKNMPGVQYTLDSDYYERMEAINFVLAHDDGQSAWNLKEAEIVILGVSRTSKTPTSIYLANRGVRVANVPLVPDCILPKELETLSGPLIVGLTRSAESLAEIRRNRLKILKQETETTYVDVEAVTKEVREAKRMFVRRGWPIIDVTRRSIEETAALILQLLKMHSGRQV